ncbi:hypothetical protein Pla123a_22780 [Posidoniimonas polymericola]|uniref:Prenyltransferase and squalene oxidase repeat protein n=1 Tax=Posidoniimonas polymericola TaxID=2528002 RepID=A0A5C5YPM9_9BACT|nr:hypothetical protein [Posidoniimonas polymericola]TWT76855.1 hypothetical protein Pla123a_22780 [Posidoniimonas polymericola]
MSWTADLTERVVKAIPGGYAAGGPVASEPMAWAAVCLAERGRVREARLAGDWLAKTQARDGSVGVTGQEPTPAWPTGLAMLAWRSVEAVLHKAVYQDNIRRAADWALAAEGRTVERKRQIGHDTTIVGWSWAADTHSWLEPTAFFVKALTRIGYGDHPRVQDGVRLLVDRLLPAGGANYGNTIVLGQELLAHVQPTGIALWALAETPAQSPLIEKAIEFLDASVSADTTTASLSYAVLGLTAQGRRPAAADAWLHAACDRELSRATNLYKLALLANASPASTT